MLDGTVAVAWRSVNTAMIVGLWKLARRLYPADTAVQALLHLLVLLAASIVAVSLILGAVGWLSAWGLAAGCAAIAVASLTWQNSSVSTTGPALACHLDESKPWERRTWALVWCAIASVLAGIVVMRGVMDFPNDWDSLKYHIPLIDLWLQTGSLYVPQTPAWSNPSNAELLGFWLVAPFSGDFRIGLANVPAALVVILGRLELGRQLALTLVTRQFCSVQSDILGSTCRVGKLRDAIVLRLAGNRFADKLY